MIPGPLLFQTKAITAGSTPEITAVAIIYFAVCAAIAIWAARRTHTATDFFAAGRGIGLWPMAMAAMAATLSGFIFIGGPGLLYQFGIYALFISLSAGITTPLSAWALAKPMRFLRETRGLITVPAAVGARYRSPTAHGLAAVAIVIASICYIGTNVLALGLVIDAIFHTGLRPGIVAGAAMVLAYSATGGILAGVYTDLFQGAIKTVASLLVFAAVLQGGGGLGGISRTILAHEPAFLGPWGTMPPLAALSLFILFGIGTLGQPQVIHKYFMLRDPRQLRWYPLVMTAVLVLTLLLFFGVGLSVKAQVLSGALPALASAEDATPTFLLHSVPTLLAAVVFSGIAAAIMGTVNAFLSIASAAVTHDLPVALGRRLGNELLVGRLATIAVMTLATMLALQSGQLVVFLGVLGWGLFASTLVPALAIGLNWPNATRLGAIWSMVVGLGSTLLFESLRHLQLYRFPAGVNASALALVLSLLTFFAVSWLTRAQAAGDLDADVRLIMEL
jgi:Na+/proline symporter